VTGKGSRSAAISLKVLGLEQYFTLIKPSSAQVPSKDEAILEVLDEWSLMPGEAIYIGDAPTDVLVARKVGCCVASVCWASTAQANVLEPLHPDAILHNRK
jgi:phosphoglycolate phosphatase-like HAD superfamily hydrolase